MIINALIAAAGASSRMGLPKIYMPLGNETALSWSVRMLSSLQTIFVTLPPAIRMSFSSEIIGFNVKGLSNFYPVLGYAGSIKSAIEFFSPMDGLVILPIDSPVASRTLVHVMLAMARMHEGPVIIVPISRGLHGHPVYVSRHFFSYFARENVLSLRELIRENSRYVSPLHWPDERILCNLNTPKCLQTIEWFCSP